MSAAYLPGSPAYRAHTQFERVGRLGGEPAVTPCAVGRADRNPVRRAPASSLGVDDRARGCSQPSKFRARCLAPSDAAWSCSVTDALCWQLPRNERGHVYRRAAQIRPSSQTCVPAFGLIRCCGAGRVPKTPRSLISASLAVDVADDRVFTGRLHPLGDLSVCVVHFSSVRMDLVLTT
jgi:hypothetical protein